MWQQALQTISWVSVSGQIEVAPLGHAYLGVVARENF